MQITVTIDVEVERIQGKFMSGDEIAEAIAEELENANPGNIDGDDGQEYEITDWSVTAEYQPRKKTRK